MTALLHTPNLSRSLIQPDRAGLKGWTGLILVLLIGLATVAAVIYGVRQGMPTSLSILPSGRYLFW